MPMTNQTREALERCETLLEATARFMDSNPIAEEYSVFYDGVTCDGSCLKEDCLSALCDVREVLREEEMRNALA